MTARASVRQLDLLGGIMRLRVSHASREYQTQLTVVAQRRGKTLELQQEITVLEQDTRAVICYLAQPGVGCDPQKLNDAVTRRRWIAYDREKADYYLAIAEQDLSESEQELEQCRNVWKKAQARENFMREAGALARKQVMLQRDEREALEIAEHFTRVGSAHG